MKRLKDGYQKKPPSRARWRTVLYQVIFEAETPTGKAFDVLLIISVLASVLVVMLDSIFPSKQIVFRTLIKSSNFH